MRPQLAEMLTATEYGMVTKGLDEMAKVLFRQADSRKNWGPDKTEHRHNLRKLARRYAALAREFEKEI